MHSTHCVGSGVAYIVIQDNSCKRLCASVDLSLQTQSNWPPTPCQMHTQMSLAFTTFYQDKFSMKEEKNSVIISGAISSCKICT